MEDVPAEHLEARVETCTCTHLVQNTGMLGSRPLLLNPQLRDQVTASATAARPCVTSRLSDQLWVDSLAG
jgi:hypothetical protein